MKTKLLDCKRKDKVSIFDLDHTLIQGNCSFYFGIYLFQHRLLSITRMFQLSSFYLFFKIGLIGLRKLHEATFKHFFCGLSVTTIDFHAKQFLSEKLPDLINLKVLAKMQEAQKKGEYTIILSSSPDFLVEKIAAFFNVDSWDSTIYQKNNCNQFSHISKFMEGVQKAQALHQLINELELKKENITAYSDSYLDLPLLLASGHPTAVNPDRRLKAFCRKYQWPIL